MGVVPKDSMSINLTQCQLPREAHTEKAEVKACQRLLGTRRGALVCSLKVLNPSVPPFSQVLTDWLSELLKQTLPLLKCPELLLKQITDQVLLKRQRQQQLQRLGFSIQDTTSWSIQIRIVLAISHGRHSCVFVKLLDRYCKETVWMDPRCSGMASSHSAVHVTSPFPRHLYPIAAWCYLAPRSQLLLGSTAAVFAHATHQMPLEPHSFPSHLLRTCPSFQPAVSSQHTHSSEDPARGLLERLMA